MRRVSLEGSPLRHSGRVTVLRVAGLLALVAVLLKLGAVQVLWGDLLVERAERQLYTTVTLRAPRGNIFDARGSLLAVELNQVFRLACNPLQIRNEVLGHKDPERFTRLVELVAPITGQSRQAFEAELRREMKREKTRRYLVLARDITEVHARQVREARMPGVWLEQTGNRIYPQGQVAGNLLGCLNAEDQPIGGIESAYDSLLRGVDGKEYHLRDAKGWGHAFSERPRQEARPGMNLELGLDLRLQTIAEEELEAAVLAHHALAGQVVLLDPRSGQISALASWPQLNPNDLRLFTPEAARLRVVTDQYEPGSTYKLVSFAAAIEAGAIPDLDEVVPCHNGAYRVKNAIIHDSNKGGYPSLKVREVFSKSSNIGTVVISQRLAHRDLYVMSRNFGFGQSLGVDLPGEVGGQLPRVGRWGPVEFANISMGQGVAVTALQMACAFACIANDGVLVRPHVLIQATGDGRQYQREALVIRRVIASETASILYDLMREVVEKGTGKQAAVPGVVVCGKTGTAQKVNPGGGYSQSDYFASFIGFAELPTGPLAGIVLVDNPRGQIYGGVVAAPAFRRIVERALLLDQDGQRSLSPLLWVEREQPALRRTAAVQPVGGPPDLAGQSLRAALGRLSPYGRDLRVAGSGLTVLNQSPPPGEMAAASEWVLYCE
ncbi:MAG: penicillin-binding transpeptidase domain-containing protein [bacterium]|jgi:cell division protein FtsI (penicillin-binding protein 3)|nr:penicillin-binding transpeptidase domain-containing protein [bacterium]